MPKLMVVYKMPTDCAAFDSYYFTKHIPIAKAIPGLRRYEVSNGVIKTAAGDSPFHLVALLSFDSLADIQHALNSPEGAAAAADLANFAQAGADLLIFDTKEV